MDAIDEQELQRWVGRSETRHDVFGPTPVAALNATLDHPAIDVVAGLPLPPLWHWLYFLPLHRQSEIGADGHARRGGFLPPVPLPRRMWAGGRLHWHQPLRLGDVAARTSTIASVNAKSGRTGHLVFVTVQHAVSAAGGLVLTEEHDIVYRSAPQPGAAAPDPLPPPPRPRSRATRKTASPPIAAVAGCTDITGPSRPPSDRRLSPGQGQGKTPPPARTLLSPAPRAPMPWFYEPYNDISAIGIHITELRHHERSEYQDIKVYDTVGHGRLLLLDDMVMLTELDEFVYHELITHIPLCVHPAPREVLVILRSDLPRTSPLTEDA
mgnify:CR=1 FL=1